MVTTSEVEAEKLKPIISGNHTTFSPNSEVPGDVWHSLLGSTLELRLEWTMVDVSV